MNKKTKKTGRKSVPCVRSVGITEHHVSQTLKYKTL